MGVSECDSAPYCTLCGKLESLRPTGFYDRITGKLESTYQCMTFGCVLNRMCSPNPCDFPLFGGKCRKCGRRPIEL